MIIIEKRNKKILLIDIVTYHLSLTTYLLHIYVCISIVFDEHTHKNINDTKTLNYKNISTDFQRHKFSTSQYVI